VSELLDLVLHAHGGLDRWCKFNEVRATIVAGGGLLPKKGLDVDPRPLAGTVSIRQQRPLIRPFGQPDWRMIFAPERVLIEATAGVVVQERLKPRGTFAGHTMNTPRRRRKRLRRRATSGKSPLPAARQHARDAAHRLRIFGPLPDFLWWHGPG
jgi:hypothetical protein